ncbi:alpha/beta fold hydrolase [Actinomycetospora lemnae]|uniref:Alpha/beta fold hydrolase n=1 Tax=Actinomycetospora lemnae TaxID=3019891 RepID=A0ABT5SZY2_9PSEU|nr:alpha/beta fold hydrolase [Actinomycetospora sp. DW7H6]MDD7968429.1 alpha/beta fold hydrolase [Actinomycetospora sp. DW7H6]
MPTAGGDHQEPRALVVFVHGLFSSARVWHPTVACVRADADLGAYDVETFEYSTPRFLRSISTRIPDLNVIADKLATFLQRKQERYERVVLVGHSQGGLVILRYIARQLAIGRGMAMAQLRRVVLFATPNNGSEFLLSMRKLLLRWHRQDQELRPVAESVVETQRTILRDVVYAPVLDDRRCPIPIACYAGETDSVVWPSSASGFFPIYGVLPGDHSGILRAESENSQYYQALRSDLLAALAEPFPSITSTLALGEERPENLEHYTELSVRGPVSVSFGDVAVPFYVCSGPVDQVRDIDVVATSENIYMEMAMTFKPSVSGRLRRAAARCSPSGEILDDTAADELRQWVRDNGRFGLPFTAGTVAPTSAGSLLARKVQRIYHVAIGDPIPGTDGFTVHPPSVATAVHNVFETARRERDQYGLDLRSILLPLFGSGLGGLRADVCFEWIWQALQTELGRDGSWSISFCTWTKAETDLVLNAIQRHASNVGGLAGSMS